MSRSKPLKPKDMELDESEIQVDYFLPDRESILEDILVAPVRLTHLPTGIKAVGEGQGSQVKNKELAMDLLKELISKEDR